MAFAIKILNAAQKELIESARWYDEQLNGLGDRFANAVIVKLELITNQPLHYPIKKSDFRESRVNDFPFIIVYKINPSNSTVIVYSIFHTRRHPGKKYKK